MFVHIKILLFIQFLLFTFSHADNELITYKGSLIDKCIFNMYDLFVLKVKQPIDYKYFHEVLEQEELLQSQARRRRAASLGRKSVGFRIIGGTAISIIDAPYQVLYGLYCGASIIAPQWVLTAAHCKERDDFVLAGSTYRSKTDNYTICAHFTHPLWQRSNKLHSHDWDYQLLFLEKPIPVTPNSRPIAIGDESDVRPGAMIGVSGWGHQRYKGRMVDELHRVFVPIVHSDLCRSLSNPFTNITERLFCAGFLSGGADSCQGDSGSPAVINGKLVGLVSFGIGCAEPNKPGVYTAVPAGRSWFRQITGLPL